MVDVAHSRPEVAVQLLGGLGNQMFQAAAGLALAERHGARLIFDVARLRDGGRRGFELAPFGLEAEIRRERPGIVSRIGASLGLQDRHRPRWWRKMFWTEAGFRFDPVFETLPASVMIAGYFQSPRYFASIAERLARQFAPEKLAGAEARSAADILAGEDSVAVHLRRGDYAADRRASAVHGVLPPRYYQDALGYLRARLGEARLFIASDDAEAAARFAAEWPGARVLPGRSAGDDLFLMSCCRHHIIANSSFSWWSAWLDRRPGGIRIAPAAWFTPEALKTRPIDDLIPADWVRL